MSIREVFAAVLRRLTGQGEGDPKKPGKETPPAPPRTPAAAAGRGDAPKLPLPGAAMGRGAAPKPLAAAVPSTPPNRWNHPPNFQSTAAEIAWPPALAGAAEIASPPGLPGAWPPALAGPGDLARELSEALRFQRRMIGTAGEFGEEIL